jgi:hypothetical protein
MRVLSLITWKRYGKIDIPRSVVALYGETSSLTGVAGGLTRTEPAEPSPLGAVEESPVHAATMTIAIVVM